MTEADAVTLGIVGFHRPNQLERLLRSVEDWGAPCLVANVENDPEVRRVAARHGARIVELPHNEGFAAAVNRLAEAARTPWFFFCNDDVEFHSSTRWRVAEAVEFARKWSASVVVPELLGEDDRVAGSLTARPTPLRFLVEWILLPDRPIVALQHLLPRLEIIKWTRSRPSGPVPGATAAAVLVDLQTLRETPMPEEYFLYWEEVAWFWRLHERGARTVQVRSLQVRRWGGRDELGPQKWRLMGRNLVRLGEERYGRVGRLSYAGLAAAWLARLAATDLVSRDRRRRWAARRAGAAGVVTGLLGR